MQLVFGVQPGVTQMCFVPSQVVPVGHAPQSFELSQPSPMTPQYWPPVNVHATLAQLALPQMPATLAPQVVPAGQVVPQAVEPPQPSPIVPQYVTPEAAQGGLFGAQPAAGRQMCLVASHVVARGAAAAVLRAVAAVADDAAVLASRERARGSLVQLGLPQMPVTFALQAVRPRGRSRHSSSSRRSRRRSFRST